MKIRRVFIGFNISILISLSMISAIPLFSLHSITSLVFWQSHYYILALIVIIAVGINTYFLINWKVLRLLEREDWPALCQELEIQVLRKNRYTGRRIKLLASGYLLLSDTASLEILETKLARRRPDLLEKNAIIFGLARMLAGNQEGAAAFFMEWQAKTKSAQSQWLHWYGALCHYLMGDISLAGEAFISIIQQTRDSLLLALSASYLEDSLPKLGGDLLDQGQEAINLAKTRVLASFPQRKNWEKELDRALTELHTVVLSNAIKGTSNRLYPAICL